MRTSARLRSRLGFDRDRISAGVILPSSQDRVTPHAHPDARPDSHAGTDTYLTSSRNTGASQNAPADLDPGTCLLLPVHDR